MFRLLTLIIACSTIPAFAETPEETKEATKESAKYTDYGSSFKVSEKIEAKSLLNDPFPFVDKTIRVSGTVTQICQKMGCWLVIADGEKSMRITTKDHAFFVKKDAAGAKCEIEGIVKSEKKNKEKIDHYASETTKGKAIPEKQVKGDYIYTMVASSVRFFEK